MRDFVIPVRVDMSPYDETYIGLRRKHTIDFSEHWLQGLISLLEKFEHDGVSRTSSGDREEIGLTANAYGGSDRSVRRVSEKAISNWYEVEKFPKTIYWANGTNIPLESKNDSAGNLVREKGFWFALSPLDLRDRDGPDAYSSSFHNFRRKDSPIGLNLTRKERARVIVRLFNGEWAAYATNKGLIRFNLSSYRNCWYWPAPNQEDKRVRFTDSFGNSRDRKLVGKSPRYGVFWHFAIEAVPIVERVSRVVMRAHVLFTHDGINPIESASRMHQLRRTFCKNWWNSRWRDMTGAFVSDIAHKGSAFLGTGRNGFSVSAKPIVFVSPVSPTIDVAVSDESYRGDLESEYGSDVEIGT